MTFALGSQVCTLVVSTLFLYILSGFLVSGLTGLERVSYLGSRGGREGLVGGREGLISSDPLRPP